MKAAVQFELRQRAKLIQALERRWPGCGAHTKHDQATNRKVIAFNDVATPKSIDQIRSYIAGWEEGSAAFLGTIQEDAPFQDAEFPAPRGLPNRQQAAAKPLGNRATPAHQTVQRRDDRAAAALAGLESLFSRSGGDES